MARPPNGATVLGPNGRPALWNQGVGIHGYDATENAKGKRRMVSPVILHEDRLVYPYARRQLIASAQDQRRNFALIQWVVNCHLDYVSSFHFRAQMKDRATGRRLEKLMNEWAKAANCDLGRRHSLRSLLRLIEGHRVVDGDVLVNRTVAGRLQLIEGSRVGSTIGLAPGDADADHLVHGVEYEPDTMAAKRYAVYDRTPLGNQLQFVGWLDAQYADLIGYFTRADQIRGLSPLACALNTAQDLYEGFDAYLQKAKLHAFLGIFFKRAGSVDGGADGLPVLDGSTDADPTSETEDYTVKVPGVLKIEGLPGDEVDMMESRVPSGEFQSFADAMTALTISTLQVPRLFYDSRN